MHTLSLSIYQRFILQITGMEHRNVRWLEIMNFPGLHVRFLNLTHQGLLFVLFQRFEFLCNGIGAVFLLFSLTISFPLEISLNYICKYLCSGPPEIILLSIRSIITQARLGWMGKTFSFRPPGGREKIAISTRSVNHWRLTEERKKQLFLPNHQLYLLESKA